MNNKKNSYILKSDDFLQILSYGNVFCNNKHNLKHFINHFNYDISLDSSEKLLKDLKNNCDVNLPIIDIYDEVFWDSLYSKSKNDIIRIANHLKPKGFNLWMIVLMKIKN